ncbi:MAG: dihydroneopterin aldolase [Chloroflexi bacterium]|nr:dihydroneopterin aldolase [Chloroflexota bacterium]
MDHILLSDLAFYGYHGAREEEKRLGQRFLVDLELSLDLQPAGRSDDLAQTVDYAEVYRLVRQVAEGPSRDLLEAVAEAIAAEVLGHFPELQAVKVRVKKPWAPIAGSQLGFVAVEITRVRPSL